MRLLAMACVGSLLLLAPAAWAQSPSPGAATDGASAPSSEPDVAMEEPMVGDRWTYEVRDEIAGTVKLTYTNTITDITATEISIRGETLGSSGYGYYVYDRAWNLKDSPTWKYAPNDGSGIKQPLTVGAAWKFQSNDSYPSKGGSIRRTGSSKVVKQESMTTRAGTFDAYRIETRTESRSTNDPTRSAQAQITTWYAPSVDHWVKRTFAATSNGHTTERSTIELVECGRR